ncbi:uncharacterized protein E0L32_009926 [Thyridium curvatum]|uniref:Erythromycin biosynthesis protein CIII-like C-terminal domain-containing protein n=1 Tax=Thyridium curvatum TaxID=1093900 RepID=A0A507AMU4_9PEZI|nr:uncharacterized protein E0L32_009926 [Thyridium curvatum]TPX08587.1 hypothetical protein E0L32_009926 [Thyridium curvatum]
MLGIARGLLDRRWSVSFLGSSLHQAAIEASGVAFYRLQGAADLQRPAGPNSANVPEHDSLPWPQQQQQQAPPSAQGQSYQSLEALPDAYASLCAALSDLYSSSPGRRVVVLAEAFFYGAVALRLGAPLPEGVPERPRSLCVSVTPPAIRSADLPPFGFPFPFDPSAQGRARNAALWAEWERRAAPLTRLLDAKLREAGVVVAGKVGVLMAGGNYTCHERILQVGLPGLEYPRCDFPAQFRIVGIMPRSTTGSAKRPEFDWWSEILANSELAADDPARKKVVVVTQGTVQTNPDDLLIPAMQALSQREDVLVVMILGSRGARLPASVAMATNARVADYLSYGAVLPYTDLWVHNGGYGAVTQGIAHGIPMVIAGDGQDKPECAKRVGWSGIGLDLGVTRPGKERLGDAIEQVLREERFRARAEELKRESEAINIFDNVEEEILKVASEAPLPR